MRLTNLRTHTLGKKIKYYDSIDSTQCEIWRLVESNKIQNGELVVAGIQTAGVGTHGRKWYTEESNNIAFSFYVEMGCKVQSMDGISIQIAEILKKIFLESYNVNLQVKKPNDLYLNGKKVGGILTESKVLGDCIRFMVIGIGINTLQKKFNKNLETIATSINKELGVQVDNEKIITIFCNEFEKAILERTERIECK